MKVYILLEISSGPEDDCGDPIDISEIVDVFSDKDVAENIRKKYEKNVDKAWYPMRYKIEEYEVK